MNTNPATDIILMVAHGNGIGTNYATRLFIGQEEGGMIATQLIDSMESGLIDFAMGGGRRHFLPEGEEGVRRADGIWPAPIGWSGFNLSA